MSNNIKVLLVGVGAMGKEYGKVLKAQGKEIIAVGRGEKHALEFETLIKSPVIAGGLEQALKNLEELPEKAIVAVNVDKLAETTKLLIKSGIKHILVEKPAGLNASEIENVKELSKENHANVYVAYNRRFYASTEKALKMIERDGGVTSFSFEFTEWSENIAVIPHPAHVKEEWLLANSSHVIDLAFFLGGAPVKMSSFLSGSLDWHSKASIYAGAGVTEKGALFSYQANWDAPGRWGVEVLTKEHRFYFRPMEKLAIQKRKSVKIEEVLLSTELEDKFKPGLYKQVEAFLDGKGKEKLLTIDEQAKHMEFYKKMESVD